MARKKPKSTYGQGSIYQDGKGRWIAQLYHEGRVIQRRAPARENTEQKAKAILAELRVMRDAGKLPMDRAPLLMEFATYWYDQTVAPRLKQGKLKPRTADDYRYKLETFILPDLGQTRLDKLKPEQIQTWLNDLADEGYAESTIRSAYNLLKTVLDQAVRWDRILSNPAAKVNAPTVEPYAPHPLNLKQARLLLKTANTYAYVDGDINSSVAYALALVLGLRRGEILGLRWSDYDTHYQVLHVRQHLQYANGAVLIGAPKTRAGQRIVPVPPCLAGRLASQYAAWHRERVKRRAGWPDHDLIVPSVDDTPMLPSNFTRQYRLIRDAAKLPSVHRFHDLRHTCASLLAANGVSEEVRAALLGHSKETITQHYSAVALENVRHAVEYLERQLEMEESDGST